MPLDIKKIKGLFVQSVEDESTTTEKKNEKPPEIKTPPPTGNNPAPTTPIPNTSGTTDSKIIDSLLVAIQNNNLPGEDYLEFMEALKAMQNINLDEKIKYQTVMATLSTKGLTKEKIIESGNHYVNVLEKEKQKFYNILVEENKKKVLTPMEEITKLENINKQKAEEIKKITEEINKNQSQMTKMNQEIETSKSKLKETEDKFNTSLTFIKDQITTNINKIKEIQ